MWAVRRGSNPSKIRGFSIGFSQAYCTKSNRASYLENNPIIMKQLLGSETSSSFRKFYIHKCSSFFIEKFNYSSQAGAKSNGAEHDDLGDGFSDLESPPNVDVVSLRAGAKSNHEEHDDFSELESPLKVDNVVQDHNMGRKDDDELFSESDGSEGEENDDDDVGDQNDLELSETDNLLDENDKRSPTKSASSGLLNSILASSNISNALDKWVKEGNELGRAEIAVAMLNLRKRRMYGRALQLSEWVESSQKIVFDERDYASRLDLIAKVRGLQKAESYIERIPIKGEVIYRTLLANCVLTGNVKKAEAVFNKMKDLEFPVTSFACNQLLLLYKRNDKKKIADVLLLMEKENVKPTIFTYRLLIDTKGQSNDISGMDQIVETMKSEGIEPDLSIQAILAKHYTSGGLKDKAEAVIKDMESGNDKQKRWACRTLLPLYAALGKADEVSRLWKICEANPRLEECMAAIEAWGQLKKVDEAEAVFEKMFKTWKKLSSKHYSGMLRVYASQKMLTKGKDLVKRMADSGVRIGPLTWDAVVKLYVEAGEVEKADSILQKAAEQNHMKPMFSSYMFIMDQYSKRGDVANAEKIFHRMRQVGYVARVRQFQSLVQAYIQARAPAYGMRERIKADNIFPNKALAGMLTQVDAFRKNAVSDLLD